jgi:hypothetical protein
MAIMVGGSSKLNLTSTQEAYLDALGPIVDDLTDRDSEAIGGRDRG